MFQIDLGAPADANLRDQFVIAPHHPDRLARPAIRGGATALDRFEHALTWNVFRTLELIAPSFWMRRLHLRLTGEPALVPPQIVRADLWRALPLPPIQRIDGARSDVVVDVVLETEHAVWTLLLGSGIDTGHDGDRVADAVDAGAWLAGARDHHCGVIEFAARGTALGAIVKERYARSRHSAAIRSATRGPAMPGAVTWGAVRWHELAALLHDCRAAHNLSGIERALAAHAGDWLRAVGVEPD